MGLELDSGNVDYATLLGMKTTTLGFQAKEII